MNKKTLYIDGASSQMATIKQITQVHKEFAGFLVIDLSEVNFPLTRDFFLVLSRRIPRDLYSLVLPDTSTLAIAKVLGIQSEVSGIQHEFNKKYSEKNLATHNMSMFEYLIYEIRRGFAYISFFLNNRTQNHKKIIHLQKNSSHFALIVIGLIMSITLLLFIFQFAVSKTVFTITPQISIRPVSANIVYAELSGATRPQDMPKNTLPLRKMYFSVNHAMKFELETVDPNSTTNARGMITIYNETTTAQALKPQTRFVSLNGVVFRSTSWVNVPPAHTLNGITEMGSVDVEIVADPRDEGGAIIGERGNIHAGQDLTIPGLKFNRDKVYAKSKTEFSGGENPKIHIVTDAEVKKFQGIIKEQLYRVARSTLQKTLDEKKQNSGDDYVLLNGEAVSFSGETYALLGGKKVGDLIDEIEIQGTISVTAIVYDKKATIAYLTDVFHDGLLTGTDRAVAVHDDTLRVANILSRSPGDTSIKATMEINTSIAHDFTDPSNPQTRALKIKIAGLSKAEAREQILNTGNVKEIEIESYPFWNQSVSSNVDHIEFVIAE